EGADAFGGLGGVLGDVARYGLMRQLTGGGDGPDVDLRAPGQRPGRHVRGGRGGDRHGTGGVPDGVGQELDGRPLGRGGRWAVGTVEADDRVEVDDAPALVFGDLGEGDRQRFAELFLCESGRLGQVPA